mmetsp:Transcript_17008/g.2807  ORF Transcript_17008/g.2807 Transcript_17008/m.2807 type:complete len:102 (-) Transcript_17008:231-536(-)
MMGKRLLEGREEGEEEGGGIEVEEGEGRILIINEEVIRDKGSENSRTTKDSIIEEEILMGSKSLIGLDRTEDIKINKIHKKLQNLGNLLIKNSTPITKFNL